MMPTIEIVVSPSIAAGMMVHQFTRWLPNIPTDADASVNLLSGDRTVRDTPLANAQGMCFHHGTQPMATSTLLNCQYSKFVRGIVAENVFTESDILANHPAARESISSNTQVTFTP